MLTALQKRRRDPEAPPIDRKATFAELQKVKATEPNESLEKAAERAFAAAEKARAAYEAAQEKLREANAALTRHRTTCRCRIDRLEADLRGSAPEAAWLRAELVELHQRVRVGGVSQWESHDAMTRALALIVDAVRELDELSAGDPDLLERRTREIRETYDPYLPERR